METESKVDDEQAPVPRVDPLPSPALDQDTAARSGTADAIRSIVERYRETFTRLGR